MRLNNVVRKEQLTDDRDIEHSYGLKLLALIKFVVSWNMRRDNGYPMKL